MSNLSIKLKIVVPYFWAFAAFIAYILVITTPASSVEVHNTDDEVYVLEIIQGKNERSITIASKATVSDVCKAQCLIVIENLGEIDALPHDIIKIENGELMRE